MSYLSVYSVDSSDSTVLIGIRLEDVDLNSIFHLNLRVFKHDMSQNALSERRLRSIFSTRISKPLRDRILIEDLDSGSMFKVDVDLLNQESEVIFSGGTFVSTKSGIPLVGEAYSENLKKELKNQKPPKGLCRSENVIKKYVEIKNEAVNIFDKKAEINRNILGARKYKAWDRFVNSEYKFSKPKFQSDLRKKRTWLVATGIEALEEIYDYKMGRNSEFGENFMQNDWAMGPFYSYDAKFDN